MINIIFKINKDTSVKNNLTNIILLKHNIKIL